MDLLHEISPGPLSRTIVRVARDVRLQFIIEYARLTAAVPYAPPDSAVKFYRRFWRALP